MTNLESLIKDSDIPKRIKEVFRKLSVEEIAAIIHFFDECECQCCIFKNDISGCPGKCIEGITKYLEREENDD